MKKLIVMLALVISAQAHSSGVYIGGQLGISTIKADILNTDNSYKSNFFTYGAFTGYEFNFEPVFAAIEADVALGDVSARDTTISYERNTLYGISGLAGFNAYQNIDLYGRLGWARTRFKLEDKIDNNNFSQSRNGLSLGGGARYRFDEKMSFRFDYRYLRYNSLEFTGYTPDTKNKEHLVNMGLVYSF